MNHEELLKKVTEFLHSEANTESIIGKPFKLGEFTCVPVIKTGMGFGTGGGSNNNETAGSSSGGGAGAGVGVVPIGFLVSRGDEISFISSQKSSGMERIFEEVPDLIRQIIKKKEDKSKTEDKEEAKTSKK